MPADLKLVYFDVRGRGEMIRMMLVAAGKEHEETRVPVSEWPQVKPTTPYGTLPYIIYKGKAYGQSIAIGSFLARELGFYGKTNEDSCRIGEVMGLCDDQVMNGLFRFRFPASDEEKTKYLKKALEEDLPRYFGYYERFLEENGSTGYVVGNALTLADFYLYDMGDNLQYLKKDALANYPLLQKLRQNVEANPRIKAYLSKRKESMI